MNEVAEKWESMRQNNGSGISRAQNWGISYWRVKWVLRWAESMRRSPMSVSGRAEWGTSIKRNLHAEEKDEVRYSAYSRWMLGAE